MISSWKTSNGPTTTEELPENQQRDLDDRLATEASQGLYPLLPGAEETDLQRLSEADQRKTSYPVACGCQPTILRQVDGFAENGVSLYGVDGELRDDQFDSGPGLLAENLVNWSGFPETIQRYLFVGDSDLWHFAIELSHRAASRPPQIDTETGASFFEHGRTGQ